MLTEIYIESRLADGELADQVWEDWDKGEVDDQVAALAWILITSGDLGNPLLYLVDNSSWTDGAASKPSDPQHIDEE